MTAMQTLVPANASMRETVEALGGVWAGARTILVFIIRKREIELKPRPICRSREWRCRVE
jgi:hypothetical protein